MTDFEELIKNHLPISERKGMIYIAPETPVGETERFILDKNGDYFASAPLKYSGLIVQAVNALLAQRPIEDNNG